MEHPPAMFTSSLTMLFMMQGKRIVTSFYTSHAAVMFNQTHHSYELQKPKLISLWRNHQGKSKFDLEQSPIYSCNCYTNPKKENNEQTMEPKDCMQ